VCGWRTQKNEEANTDEALGRSRGGFSTKIHVKVDSLGNPLALHITGGQRADVSQAEQLLADGIAGDFALGDKGYDSNDLVEFIIECGSEPVIPSRKSRKQPREYDKHRYKERHLVECFIGKLKYYRRIFSRFDKYSRHYLSYLQFASALIWLR
jgi:transposase